MIRNYFFLNRLILEINALLNDTKVIEIFSQEKGTLVINCDKSGENIFIEFSVTPGIPHLSIKKKYTRAKKNTINFFTEGLGEKLISFEIAEDDRIVKLNLTHSSIFFAIRGKYTNLFYLTEDNRFIPFKSVQEEILNTIQREFLDKTFLSSWNELHLATFTETSNSDQIRKKYPIIGSDILREVKTRTTDSSNDKTISILNEVLDEIRNSKPCVFIDNETQEANLGFEHFKSFSFTEKKIFESPIEAQNFLLSKEYYLKSKSTKYKLVRNHLERELNKVTSKYQNLKGVIERGSQEDKYNKLGKLLLANLNSIKPGMKSITVEDVFSDGENIEIPINSKILPQQNVENYFNKSKAEKTAFAKTRELFQKTEKNYRFLQKKMELLDNIEKLSELEDLMKELKIKSEPGKEKSTDLSDKFKHYIVDEKYNVYVGKDSKNNDLLTTKFAKQNDYWFHARSVSGSHVVLRVENTKEPVPKNILKKVASLAAYHSKAKTAGIVPVAFTFKKYVVKKKGDSVGTVHLLREDVLLVKPEIPKGCEFIIVE